MPKQNPRKDGVRFGANNEIMNPKKEVQENLEQVDVSQQIADLAWGINFKEQADEKITQEVEDILINIKKSEQNEN